jgi:hypothetical protein
MGGSCHGSPWGKGGLPFIKRPDESKRQQAGGKEDGAQGVGLNTDKVREALEVAQKYLLDGKA